MSFVDNNDLTTDAMPSPPRDNKTENLDNGTTNDKEDFEEEPIKNNENTQTGYKGSSNLTMINVIRSNHVHVGSNTTIVFNKKEAKKKYLMTDAVRALRENKSPLTKRHISFLATHIGDGWKNAARALDYSEGQINQLYIDNYSHGIREVIYQFLLDWIQNEPEKATIGKLASVLWESEEKDAVNRWSKEIELF